MKPTQAAVELTAELVEAFAGAYLSPRYDNPAPTPPFHRQAWALYCSDAQFASVVAPREHAKSTALTHDFGLAMAMWRSQDYIVIVSATEDLAMGHLGDIAKECRENEDMIRDFGIVGLPVDAKTDLIVDFKDGHQCRFIARGSGQKMRGLKWNGKRPGLILGDDLEEDEQVENLDRRKKFRKWVNRALLPCLRKGGKARFHGTILHEDAILARIQRQKDTWATLFFKAHKAFDDFTEILWPEAWTEARLRATRQRFIDDGDADGYAQEYLNDPSDHSQAYLKKENLIAMEKDDYTSPKINYVGCDFAVSKADSANRTSFTVGGLDPANMLHVHAQYVNRKDTLEWIELLFDIQQEHAPAAFFVEDGVIWKSVYPMIRKEMMRREKFLNFVPMLPIKDKAVRGRPLQKRTKAQAMRFDKEAEWYENYEYEILKFTGVSDALADDQFDSTALLVKGLEDMPDAEQEDFTPEEEEEMIRMDPRKIAGRSPVTGY